jgi:hypothetical protein
LHFALAEPAKRYIGQTVNGSGGSLINPTTVAKFSIPTSSPPKSSKIFRRRQPAFA